MEEQGIAPERYRVVPRTLVFARRDGEILLLHRSPERRLFPDRYNGVGGHVEAGEGILASARREVAEEAGVGIREVRLSGLVHVTEPSAPDGVLLMVFTAEASDAAVSGSSEGEPCWVRLDDVSRLPVVPDLAEMLPRLWPDPADPPFVAVSRGSEGDTLVFEDGGTGALDRRPSITE